MLAPPYVPVNVAALSEAGLAGEIQAQLARGTELLRAAGTAARSAAPWVDTAASFAQGDAANLASGLQVAGADQLVLSDGDLASAGSTSLTFAQPFNARPRARHHRPAAAAEQHRSAPLFTATPADPVLGAEQLLAGLRSSTSRTPSSPTPAGSWSSPPSGWRASTAFMDTLLAGLTQNPALTPVTLSQLFAQVPGRRQRRARRRAASRRARPAAASRTSRGARIARRPPAAVLLRCGRAPVERPPSRALTALNDLLLTTESQRLGTRRALRRAERLRPGLRPPTGKITLATERTVTFTAQRAPIPITVLSSAPYPVSVVVTLGSDKFTFPDGNTRPLTARPPDDLGPGDGAGPHLGRPPPHRRDAAHARRPAASSPTPCSPCTRPPSPSSGVALTVLAGAVLLVWWVRTWRRSRRPRPRAH